MLIIRNNNEAMYKDMYTLACAYAHSGNLNKHKVDIENEHLYVFPSILFYALSIEIFLKFFLVVDYPEICCKDDLKKYGIEFRSKKSNGHGYSALWDSIGAEYQARVIGHYRRLSGEMIAEQRFREILQLELGDDPFVKFRYIYEVQSISFLSLKLISLVNDALGFSAEEVVNEKAGLS